MDKIEKAREMFQRLEAHRVGNAVETAKRTFFIQESLIEIRGL